MSAVDKIRGHWNQEVRPIINKCIEGYDVLLQIEDGQGTIEEKEKLVENLETRFGKRDWNSVWYIGQMAGKVEHALSDDRDPRIAIVQARATLTSDSFYKNVFGGIETEETQNYRALGKKLDEMLKL